MGSSTSRAVPQYQAFHIDEMPAYDAPGRYYESISPPDITSARAGISVGDPQATLERRNRKLRQGGLWQGTPMTDVEYAYELRMERVSQRLEIGNDTQLAKSIAGDGSYLRTMANVKETQQVAEMPGRDKPLPARPKSRRVRFADPTFVPSRSERAPDTWSNQAVVSERSTPPPQLGHHTSIWPGDEVYHRTAEAIPAETEREVWSEWVWVPVGPVDGHQFKSLPAASSSNTRPSISNQGTSSDLSGDAFLKAMVVAEEAAREDRRMAQMLERGEHLPPPKSCQLKLMDPEFVLCPPQQVQVPALHQRHTNKLVRKDPPASVNIQPTVEPRVECIICCEVVKMRKTIRAPCKHRFCRRCITSFVEGCTKDESMYPLRCCLTPIPNEILAQLVSAPLMGLFERKEKEYQVPASTRLYCGEPTCASFIGARKPPQKTFMKKTRAKVTCPTCLRSTCTKCKNLANRGHECPPDEAERTFKELAKRQAWATCPKCFSTVERTGGCNHMVCRCNMEFCYRCAKPWKNHKACG